MKKAKGLKKRWYMLRDLLGMPSSQYNYHNNYIHGFVCKSVFDEEKFIKQVLAFNSYKVYQEQKRSSYLEEGN